MFASLSLTSVKTARPPVTWIERAKEHTADAKQRSTLFYLLNSALLLENKKKGGIVIAFDSCRRVFLRVSGSFCERAFFVWFAITYIGNAPFDPRTATRTGKVHSTQRADAERGDEKVDERRSTRWCASLGTVSRVIQLGKQLRRAAAGRKINFPGNNSAHSENLLVTGNQSSVVILFSRFYSAKITSGLLALKKQATSLWATGNCDFNLKQIHRQEKAICCSLQLDSATDAKID